MHALVSLVDGVVTLPSTSMTVRRRAPADGDLAVPVSARINAGGDRVLCHRLVRQLPGRQLFGPGGNVTDRLSAATTQGGIRTHRTTKNPRDQDGDRHATQREQEAVKRDYVRVLSLSLWIINQHHLYSFILAVPSPSSTLSYARSTPAGTTRLIYFSLTWQPWVGLGCRRQATTSRAGVAPTETVNGCASEQANSTRCLAPPRSCRVWSSLTARRLVRRRERQRFGGAHIQSCFLFC